MRRPALPLAVLAVLAVAVLASAGAASPQPSPICGFCGDGFEDTAADRGVNATVAESTVTVQVHENGSATWTVRNRLSNGSATFREDPGLLEDVARRSIEDTYGVIEDPEFVAATMDGDAAVLTYRDTTAAERHAGLLVVDYLHHEGRERWLIVDADAFTVRGPPGTVVTNDPASGTVDGDAVTWRGSTDGQMYEAPRLEGYPLVVFGPDRSAGTSVRTTAALASASSSLVVGRVQVLLLVPGAVFALTLALVGYVLREHRPSVRARSVGVGVGALAGGGGLALAVVHGPRTLPGPAVFGVLLAAATLHGRTGAWLRTPRRQALAAAVGLVVTWAVLAAAYAGIDRHGAAAWVAVRSTALALPFAALLPFGGALDGHLRRAAGWGGGALLSFAAMVALVVDFTAPWSGLGGGLFVLGSVAAAVLVPVLGAAVALLGQRLSVVEPPRETPTRGPEDV